MLDFNAALKPETFETPPPAAPPTPAASFGDIGAVKKALAEYDESIASMVQQADALEVTDEESNVLAVEMAGQIKKLNKAVEALRKKFVEEPKAYAKSVDALAKSYKDRFDRIERGLKTKIAQYQSRVELERRKKEEAARQAAAEAQRKLDEEAEAAGVEPVRLDQMIMPEPEKVTRTGSGAAYQRKAWTFEIEDEALIPREYLVVDEKAIREAVKAGVRNISGVRIFEENRTVIRT